MSQENQSAQPEKDAGGYGTPTVEQEMGGAGGGSNPSAETNEPEGSAEQPVSRDPEGVGFEDGDALVPSTEAEIDESNSDGQESGRFTSEQGQDAAGIPDGSGNDQPREKNPKDDDGESFSAG